MKNILIINGHQRYPSAEGHLNRTLADHMASHLGKTNAVKTTVLQAGYSVEEEQHKFLWADIVIYQTPIYWFSVPGLLKTYMDEVYAYGLFFKGASQYGRGGLLTGKRYMFSTTWNAPAEAFGDPAQFFRGEGLEDALRHLHRAQEFLGMQPLPSFACYNAVKHPDIGRFVSELESHVNFVLQAEAISENQYNGRNFICSTIKGSS